MGYNEIISEKTVTIGGEEGIVDPFPVSTIKLDLLPDTPTKITPDKLGADLKNIGLDCSLTKKEVLEKYIQEGRDKLRKGKKQSYRMLQGIGVTPEMLNSGDVTKLTLADIIQNSGKSGTWKPKHPTGTDYDRDLVVISIPANFDLLLENRVLLGFTGVKRTDSYSGRWTTEDAFKEQLNKTAVAVDGAVSEGLDLRDMESLLADTITPSIRASEVYDSGLKTQTTFIVDNYNGRTVDGIGLVTLEWTLKITNYKKKKKSPVQNYSLTLTVKTVTYSSSTLLAYHINYIKAAVKDALFMSNPMPIITEVRVFDDRPPADENTFALSLPLATEKTGFLRVLVLYNCNLEAVGTIDNRDSGASSTYSKTITTGFSFSAAQKIGVKSSFAANKLIKKSSVEVSFEMTFTQSTSVSKSETVSFTAPAKTVAYLYQGILRCAVLEYDAFTWSYSYVEGEDGVYHSNVLRTTDKPIGNAEVKPIANEAREKYDDWWLSL